MEGSFGVELTGAIFFPRPLPGFGGISNSILLRKKLTKLMFSQQFSLIDFYITSGSVDMPSGHFREYILHLTMASRWLQDIVKPSHTIRINIVCKTTTSCIVRDCIGYNRVSIVCPSLRTCFGSTLAFYQIRDKNRAKFKISYTCGHRVSKSARSDAILDVKKWKHERLKIDL